MRLLYSNREDLTIDHYQGGLSIRPINWTIARTYSESAAKYWDSPYKRTFPYVNYTYIVVYFFNGITIKNYTIPLKEFTLNSKSWPKLHSDGGFSLWMRVVFKSINNETRLLLDRDYYLYIDMGLFQNKSEEYKMSVLYSVEFTILPYNVLGFLAGLVLVRYWYVRKKEYLFDKYAEEISKSNN